jgi:MFS family permease
LTLFAVILSMPYFFLLPVFTREILVVNVENLGRLTSWPLVGELITNLSQSSARQGLLISISGTGALVGSFIVASMSNKRRGLFLLISVLIVAITLVVFSFTQSYLMALIIFIPLGFGQTGRMALSNTLLQTLTEDAYRGRVMSVYMMEFGVMSVGVFVVGVLADYIGIQWAVGGAAIILVFISLYFLLFTSRIRNLD